jgi:hypothetical protein
MNADSPHYAVGGHNLPKKLPVLKFPIVLVKPAPSLLSSETVVGYAADADYAKLIVGFLNESVRLNNDNSIATKCDNPACDMERQGRRIPIFASELDAVDLLYRAAIRCGVDVYCNTPYHELSREQCQPKAIVAELASTMGLKCPDCGYAPDERGTKTPQSSPTSEHMGRRFADRETSSDPTESKLSCPPPIREQFINLDVDEAPRTLKDVEWQWYVELLNGGVRLQHIRIGSFDGPEPPSEHFMDEDAAIKHVKSLAGRILTVIDASFPEGSQRNAFKSLIKREVRTQLGRIIDFFQAPGCSTGFNNGEAEVTQEL